MCLQSHAGRLQAARLARMCNWLEQPSSSLQRHDTQTCSLAPRASERAACIKRRNTQSSIHALETAAEISLRLCLSIS